MNTKNFSKVLDFVKSTLIEELKDSKIDTVKINELVQQLSGLKKLYSSTLKELSELFRSKAKIEYELEELKRQMNIPLIKELNDFILESDKRILSLEDKLSDLESTMNSMYNDRHWRGSPED